MAGKAIQFLENFHYPFGITSAYANICHLPTLASQWDKMGRDAGANYSTVGQRF